MHQSIAVLKSPEFINLTSSDISPFVAECQIKVLYLGENRNRSYISREAAEKMSKTLRGSPIAGYYKEENEDFRDHGEEITLDGDGVHFNKKTKPYGFIPPDAKVWFQDYEDTDENQGKVYTRTYLVTTGYIWLKQFPECEKIFENNGKGQSMELDEETLNGVWSNDINPYVDFFIINDAIFTQLCILGDDVEPCFEGASITPIEKENVKEPNFVCSLFTMMKDFQFALEGGNTTMNDNNPVTVPTEGSVPAPVTEEPAVSAENNNTTPTPENSEDNSSTTIEDKNQGEIEDSSSTFAKDKKKTCKNEKNEEDEDEDKDDNEDDDDDDKKEPTEHKCGDKKKKYELLEEKYNELENKYNLLKADYDALAAYKNEVESSKKEELLKSFSLVLSEEEMEQFKDVSKFSLDELESKLSILESRHRRASTKEQPKESTVTPSVTFNLDSEGQADIPDFVKALNAMKQKMN